MLQSLQAELQASISELKRMGPAALTARFQVLDQRVKLEERLPAVANELDVGEDVAFLVLDAAWRVRIEALDESRLAGFGALVEADVRDVLESLATGAPLTDEARIMIRAEAIKDGMAGREGTHVGAVLSDASNLISRMRPTS